MADEMFGMWRGNEFHNYFWRRDAKSASAKWQVMSRNRMCNWLADERTLQIYDIVRDRW